MHHYLRPLCPAADTLLSAFVEADTVLACLGYSSMAYPVMSNLVIFSADWAVLSPLWRDARSDWKVSCLRMWRCEQPSAVERPEGEGLMTCTTAVRPGWGRAALYLTQDRRPP